MNTNTTLPMYYLKLAGPIKGFHPGFKRMTKVNKTRLNQVHEELEYFNRFVERANSQFNGETFDNGKTYMAYPFGGDYFVILAPNANPDSYDFIEWNGRLSRKPQS